MIAYKDRGLRPEREICVGMRTISTLCGLESLAQMREMREFNLRIDLIGFKDLPGLNVALRCLPNLRVFLLRGQFNRIQDVDALGEGLAGLDQLERLEINLR